MKTILFSLLIFILLIMPFVSADLIQPGFKYIQIENKITNMVDFQNYDLISVCNLGGSFAHPKIIQNDGKIESYYKYCNVQIYALQKGNINISNYERIENDSLGKYLNQSGAKLLAKGIVTTISISVTSPIENIAHEYTLDLNKVKSSPDNSTNNIYNYSYFYLTISLIALLSIIIVLVRRKNND